MSDGHKTLSEKNRFDKEIFFNTSKKTVQKEEIKIMKGTLILNRIKGASSSKDSIFNGCTLRDETDEFRF